MKKLFTWLILAIFVLGTLTGCQNFSGNNGDTSSDNSVPTSSDNWASSYAELNGFTEIDDDRITTTDKGKTFTELGISLNVPADWGCFEQGGEDGTSYSFVHPKLKEKCELNFYITSADYKYERTESEYMEYYSDIDLENVKIISCVKEKLCGFEGTKVVATYTDDGEELIRIDFNNVITGVRMYNFSATYPASDKESKAAVESILDSIVITAL